MKNISLSILLLAFIVACSSPKNEPNDIIKRLKDISSNKSISGLDVLFDSIGYVMEVQPAWVDTVTYYRPKVDTSGSDYYLINKTFTSTTFVTPDYKNYIEALKGLKIRGYKENEASVSKHNITSTEFADDTLHFILLKEAPLGAPLYSISIEVNK